MNEHTALEIAKRIKAIADIGLLYSKDNFDKERYHELRSIGETLITSGLNIPENVNVFAECVDYPTPKVDIRAFVLNDKHEILLVQEKADERWSLPGGWAEIGQTPSAVAMQEVFEETGLKVSYKHLAAVFDKRMHVHPPQPWYVYKMIFYCETDASSATILKPAFDVLGAGWFDINALPPLSTDRILKEQIAIVYKNILNKNFKAIFD